jgi:hypothetical protein
VALPQHVALHRDRAWFGSATSLGLRLGFHHRLCTIGDYISAALRCTMLSCAVIGSTCGLVLLFAVHRRLALHQQLCWRKLAPRLACVAHGSSSALHRACRSPALSLLLPYIGAGSCLATPHCKDCIWGCTAFVWRLGLHGRSLALCSAWFCIGAALHLAQHGLSSILAIVLARPCRDRFCIGYARLLAMHQCLCNAWICIGAAP